MEARTRHSDLALNGSPGASPQGAQPAGFGLGAADPRIVASANDLEQAPLASASGAPLRRHPESPTVVAASERAPEAVAGAGVSRQAGGDSLEPSAAPIALPASAESSAEMASLVARSVSGAVSPSRAGSDQRPPVQAAAAAASASLTRPLLGMSLAELQDWCRSQGQPAFRAKQLHEWIYARGARSLEAITVLPKAWRQQLAAVGVAGDAPAGGSAIQAPMAAPSPDSSTAEAPASRPAPGLDHPAAGVGPAAAGAVVPDPASGPIPGSAPARGPQVSDAWIGRSRELLRSEARDGTVKLLLGTRDGLSLETVGIPSGDRLTVCVSSQVGCPMACRFCATGKGGLQRSLAVHEIVDQVLAIREVMGRRPSHVVFMGMGEPLLNLEAVLAAIDCLCTDLGMAQRQITVSTVGVPAALPALAERALERLGRAQFTLAVSLHAPDQALRQRLIPTAHAYPLERLLDDCRTYVAITGRRVSFEYILLGGVNDQPRHAEALARLLRGFQSHVNLIPYNPIEEEDFRRPTPEAVEAFRRGLQERRIAVSVRASRGLDADAACGQLRRRQLQGAAAG